MFTYILYGLAAVCKDLLGGRSGLWGTIAASVIGSITLIPGFVAFPLAASLLQSDAGTMQIAAFVSTLMMVGAVTLTLEIKTFGRRAAFVRNAAAYVSSIAGAVVIWAVLSKAQKDEIVRMSLADT